MPSNINNLPSDHPVRSQYASSKEADSKGDPSINSESRCNQQFEGFDTVNFQERDGLFRMEQQAFNNERSMEQEQSAINNSYKLGGSNGTPKPKRHGQVRVSIEDLRQD